MKKSNIPLTGESSRRYDSSMDYPEQMKGAFWLFLVFIAFTYLQAGIRFPLLAEIRAEFLLGGVLALLAVLMIGQRRPVFEWTPVAKWGSALVLLLLFMTIFSIDFDVSWDVFFNRVFKFSLIGLFIAAFVTSPSRLRLFLLVYLLVMAKLGQEGLSGTITGSMIWENQGIPRLHGSTPSYMHPNSYSGVAVSALPFIAFLFPLVSRKWKIALLVLLILMLNIILRTGSRTGYVALFIGLLWFCMYAKHRARSLLIVVVTAAMAVPFIPDDYIGRAASIFEPVEVGEDTSVGKRKEILVDAWEVFKRRPLGVGVGAFPVIREQWYGRVQDTHNLYLEVATNAGGQGLFVFGGLIVAIIVSLRRSHRMVTAALESFGWQRWAGGSTEANTPIPKALVQDLEWIRATTSAFLGFIVIRLALGLFGMDLYERYWWFAGGAAIAISNLTRHAARLAHRTKALDVSDGAAKANQPLRTTLRSL